MTDLYFASRAERDRQYNARATVPDFSLYMQQYAELSRQMRASVPGVFGLQYGSDTAEALDLFPAAGGRKGAPLFVYIHGGYWRALSKEDSSFMARSFTDAGVALAVLDYALAPHVTLEEIVRQNRAAITWLHEHAAEYGIDPGQIHVGGSSAGGHLGAMLLAAGWQETFGLPPEVIRSACLLSGLFDLGPLCDSHINEWMQLTPERAQAMSPLFRLPAQSTRLTLAVGGQEMDGFKRQTTAYAAACQASGLPMQVVDMPAHNHFDLVLELMDADSPLTAALMRQIRACDAA